MVLGWPEKMEVNNRDWGVGRREATEGRAGGRGTRSRAGRAPQFGVGRAGEAAVTWRSHDLEREVEFPRFALSRQIGEALT